MKQTKIEAQLDKIEKLLKVQKSEPLTFSEASKYLGISHSYLYKMTCRNKIPYFKPNGKKIYFEKSELNEWIFRKRISSKNELDAKVNEHVAANPHLS